MHDNAYYICAKSFEYDEVKIVPNINNVDEIISGAPLASSSVWELG
ncbi:hypothetical protein IXZ18_10200 [Campylobacter fetus subsp. venerealis bv. intermedius]|nr:hypothetical protein [Campylobacter fetus]WKW28995.1 hypothetical protein IXZ18_10200 [Campylobacter fetus subsp. venerealis bv. intermedius]